MSERILARGNDALLETARMLERLDIYDELEAENPALAQEYWDFVQRGYGERMSEGKTAYVLSQALAHRAVIRKDLEAV